LAQVLLVQGGGGASLEGQGHTFDVLVRPFSSRY